MLRARAAGAVASGAPESAVDCLRRALEEPPTEEIRPAVMFELGTALGMVASPDAITVLGKALEIAAGAEAKARVALVLADVLQHSGELARGVEILVQALGNLPAGDTELAPRLEGRLLPLACSGVSGRRLVGDRVGKARRQIATLVPEHARVVRATVAFDLTTGEGANAATAAGLAREALADGYLLGLRTPEAVFAIGAVNALFLSGHFDEAEAAFEPLLEHAQERGLVVTFTMFSTMRSWSRWLNGSLVAAEADARVCLDSPDQPAFFVLYPLAATVVASAMLERGEHQEAAEVVADFGAFREDDDLGFSQLLHIVCARILLNGGDAEGAIAALQPCRRFEAGWGMGAGIACVVPWRVVEADALVMLDRRAEAVALASEQLGLAREFGAPRPIGEALCALGRAEGPELALETLEEAAATLADSGARLEQGRAMIELGAAVRRTGQPSRARELLSAGVDLTHRCGATVLARRGHDELVAAGARPRRLATSGPESLTASERRVAEMALGGMTNREVAQALFVTLRTVEGHLTHAFRKLAISSRNELGQALGNDSETEGV